MTYRRSILVLNFTTSDMLTAGDVNGDGRVDLVIGNRTGADVCIMLQPSLYTGSWARYTKEIDGKASDIELVDAIGQGRSDLVYCDAETSRVYIYENTGLNLSASSRTPVPVTIGDRDYVGIAIGELSGSSGPDLVTLSGTGGNASAFFRNTISSWYGQPNITFPTNLKPLQALVDGRFLLILSRGTTNGNGSLEMFLSEPQLRGNADHNLFLPGLKPTKLASARMPDGNIILVGTNDSTTSGIIVYEHNTSRLNFLNTQNGPVGVAFGDFDSDGLPDIAVANGLSRSVSIYLGASDLFSADYPDFNLSLGALTPVSVATSSLRGNSLDDIIVGCTDKALILYNTGDSSIFRSDHNETIGSTVAGPRHSISAGDFNRDGTDGDIVLLNTGTSTVEFYHRIPSGSIGAYYNEVANNKITRTGSNFISMTVADFGRIEGGVGFEDIAILDQSRKLYFFEQPSYGFIINLTAETASIQLKNSAANIRTGDLNDDGKADLLITHSNLPSLAVFLRIGEFSFKNSFNFTTGGIAADMVVSDIDGDSRCDIVASSPGSRALSLWFQNNLVPKAFATASTYSEMEGVDVTFYGTQSSDSFSDRNSLEYYWDFGDGDYEYGSEIEHRFLDDSIYQVSLRVTDRGGLANYSNLTVAIGDASPVASFTFSPDGQVEGSVVTFNDTSSSYPDSIVAWSWEFGDGETASTRNATHVYVRDGTFTANLTVYDEDGSSQTAWRVVNVTDGSPTASFTASTTSPIENTTVSFRDTSSSYPDVLVGWAWDFGDGSFSTLPNPAHVFAQNGTYTVTLTVTDEDGSTDSASTVITVGDTVPTASFSFLPASPSEGQGIQFTDQSSAYDGVVSWHWDFGDGSESADKDPEKWYADNGTYSVELTVTDGDGSIAVRTLQITVRDTSPTISLLTASAGSTPIYEDARVTFRVVYTRAWEEPQNFTYQWDFSYSFPFVSDETTILNQTTHSFAQEGTYIVMVRVWDSDSFAEKTLTVEIANLAPVARFSYQPAQGGQIQFDASLSEDTPSDVDTLQYRWNFNDGTLWTNWSSSPIILHAFVTDGNYSVVLNVRDNDNDIGTVTNWVLVDRTKPVVSGILLGEAFIGKPIIVKANISDNLGIESVVLYYRIGNETMSSEMLRVGGTGDQWEGQIRSQNSTVTLYFWIEANDTSGNRYTTSEYEVKVVPGPLATEMWLGGLGLAGIVLGGVYVFARRRYATVDEVFVIYEDGCLMAHATRRLKPGMDDEVLSSMLVAIQSFVKDSFKDEKTTALKRLDFGEKKILVEKWDRVYLAAVLHGKHAGKIPQRMLEVLEGIQRDYGAAIAEWDGDLEKVRGVRDMTEPLFNQPLSTKGISVAVLRVIRHPGRPKGKEVIMTECPVCDQPVPSDARECPSCGAELGSADIDYLERVANDMLQDKGPEKPDS